MVVRVGFLKLGNIGTAPLVELLLDERAEREDVEFRVVGTGPKLTPEHAVDAARKLAEFRPDIAIVISPNATLPGPTQGRQILAEAGIPTIVISDAPTKQIRQELEEKGFGYIIVEADPMIGARREFLDPVEMALFNVDVIKVLAITGVFNLIQRELNAVIEAVKRGEKPTLPRVVVTRMKAVEAAGFTNPYAKAKALAAYETAKNVAALTTAACFKIKEWEKYTLTAASAHEMIRTAAKLAEEAREIEKSQDTVLRTPHHKDGTILTKRKLIEKPKRPE
ncbi:MAG TPA: F420-dependent methylenetetrahydromethanopterin dehydrogenase [Candidatus Bathyarchaeota archaeon]|nr:F420-dependent methylenetetrahydromethanopterin dehydrogenase [Candidatus Bathyarchaeota archaeon]